MDFIYYLPFFFVILILIIMFIFHFKKKKIIAKIKNMTPCERMDRVNNIVSGFGYSYNRSNDIFTTLTDAPQKTFGYTALYDLFAPYFNMIFDYETIYFDYDNRTWLIEFWKGQYGINTGCEIGIYYADSVISPDRYNHTLFKAVQNKDMLNMSVKLNRLCKKKCTFPDFYSINAKHWWLTLFKMGIFTKPKNLSAHISITFKDYDMLNSFTDSFLASIPDTTIKINGLTVYFTFCKSTRHFNAWKCFIRTLGLFSCNIYCKLFNLITKPFSKSGDKVLYIYYYMPFLIRLAFKKRKR